MDLYDVVVIGDANPDLILSGADVVPRFGQVETLVDDASLTLGGSAAITAAGLARLGLRTALMAVVGDDPLGRLTITQLQSAGVDTSPIVVDSDVATGVSVHLVDGGDRAIITYLGAIAALERCHIDSDVIESTGHVHVGSLFLLDKLRPQLAGVLTQARGTGATTSLDTNWDPTGRWDVDDLLDECDVLFPNETEAGAIGRRPVLATALDVLESRGLTVAVKLGASGGLLACGGSRHRIGAPATAIADAIGAGDSFDAGYIFGMVTGKAAIESLALAVACGSLSVRASGGTNAQATRAEAEALATELR